MQTGVHVHSSVMPNQTNPIVCRLSCSQSIYFKLQGDPKRLWIVISLWQVSKSQKMAKPNHFWKWYIGRFWYFDVSKESGENNLAFQGFAKLVGLSPTRLDPAWNEPSDSPLSPTEHLEHIETYLYTPRQSHIFIFIPKTASGAKRCQQTLPDNRRFISPCKIESISSQPTKLTKPWKARLFTPDTFETSKYQNLPIYHFQKWLGFASFCDFDTRHKEITIHSLFGSPCINKLPMCQMPSVESFSRLFHWKL